MFIANRMCQKRAQKRLGHLRSKPWFQNGDATLDGAFKGQKPALESAPRGRLPLTVLQE